MAGTPRCKEYSYRYRPLCILEHSYWIISVRARIVRSLVFAVSCSFLLLLGLFCLFLLFFAFSRYFSLFLTLSRQKSPFFAGSHRFSSKVAGSCRKSPLFVKSLRFTPEVPAFRRKSLFFAGHPMRILAAFTKRPAWSNDINWLGHHDAKSTRIGIGRYVYSNNRTGSCSYRPFSNLYM